MRARFNLITYASLLTGGAVGGFLVGSLSNDTIHDKPVAEKAPSRNMEIITKVSPEDIINNGSNINSRFEREDYYHEQWVLQGKNDGATIAEWVLTNLKGLVREQALISIAEGWAENDPASAATWFNNNSYGSTQDGALRAILMEWGEQDGRTALDWANTSLVDQQKSMLMDALAEGWASADPVSAIEAGLSMVATDYGDEFVLSAMQQWAFQAPNEAVSYLDNIEDNHMKLVSYYAISDSWASNDKDSAIKWLEQLKEDQGVYEVATNAFVQNWSRFSPEEAIDWTLNPENKVPQKNFLIQDIVTSLTFTSPGQITTWINNNSAKPEAEIVIRSFTENILSSDPEAALDWAGAIIDERRRLRHQQGLLETWLELDPSKAQLYIDNSNLPSHLKNSVSKTPLNIRDEAKSPIIKR